MADLVERIMAWEQGRMSDEEEVQFFQGLVDSGLAWQLQGCYGRNAMRLIKAGLVVDHKRPTHNGDGISV